jgi:hypothetical protein
MSTEYWSMYQKDTPNVNNAQGLANYLASPQVAGLNIGAPFGAQCSDPNVVSCTSKAQAFVNYVVYQAGPRDFFTMRNGFFNDAQGQRTGFATKYHEFVLGWNHWIGKAITVRPEARFEHAGIRAYDNPQDPLNPSQLGKRSQAMLAMDLIVHF